jgi:Arc/MetJ-type ribon-helix-helix transcriptional regulator
MVYSYGMETARKITVEVPPELLEKAQQAIGAGITETIRTGLRLVAASRTYAQLRELRGKVRFSQTSASLKADR